MKILVLQNKIVVIIFITIASFFIGVQSLSSKQVLQSNLASPPQHEPFMVYSDIGIAEGDMWIWSGADWGLESPKLIKAKDTSTNVPEGKECFTVKGGTGSGNYIGWGVFLGSFNSKHELIRPHTVDLSHYDSLIFWVKTSIDLKVELQQDFKDGAKSDPCFISNFGWKSNKHNAWQKMVIPKKVFKNVNLKKIFSPFQITGKGSSITFSIDDVKWVVR